MDSWIFLVNSEEHEKSYTKWEDMYLRKIKYGLWFCCVQNVRIKKEKAREWWYTPVIPAMWKE
jgi:hypothetical protein